MDLTKLKKIEEQALELEVNIRRAMIEMSESLSSQSESWREFENLQRRLRELRADLRAAIRSHSSTWRSHGRSRFDGGGRLPPWVRSDPNIPSTLVNPDFGFDSLTKWQSMNASIKFKKKSKDIVIFLRKDLSDLEICLRWIIREELESEIQVQQNHPQQYDRFSSLQHDDDLDDDLFPAAVNILNSGPHSTLFLAQELEGGTGVQGIHPHRIDQFSSQLYGQHYQEALNVISNYLGSPNSTGQRRRVSETV